MAIAVQNAKRREKSLKKTEAQQELEEPSPQRKKSGKKRPI